MCPVASFMLSHLVSVNIDQHSAHMLTNALMRNMLICPIGSFLVSYLQKLGADFKIGRLDARLLGALPPALDALKQLVNSPWDDALLLLAQAHIETRSHGVGLP